MNFLRNLVYFLVVIAMLVLGVLFAVQNTVAVPLDLLVITLAERSLALWVLLAFAVGGVIGMLTSLGMVLRLRTELMGARRKLAKLDAAAAAPEVETPAAVDPNVALASPTDKEN